MSEKHLPDNKTINRFSPTSLGIGLGSLGKAMVCPIGFFACVWFTMGVTYRFTERVFLSAQYGADRYAAGLRVVRKHYLSDGTQLPAWIEVTQAFSTFMLGAPVIVTYYFIAKWMGLWPEAKQEEGRWKDHRG